MMRQTAGSGPSMIVPGSPETVSPYQLQWEDFAAWIEKDRPPRVTPEDGVRAVEIALAALKSNETGKPVNL
jgi:predicted dehydrogenase